MLSDPADVIRAVAAGVSRLVSGDLTPQQREDQLDALAALYAETTDVVHPFAPLGVTPMHTRAQLRAHFARAGDQTAGITRFEVVDRIMHRTEDPEVVVWEFARTVEAHGRASVVPSIYVVRVRAGEIVESRDYSDHVAMARAAGRIDVLAAQLIGEARNPISSA